MDDPISKDDTIEHMRELLEGRRVLSVKRRVYDHGPADYPVLSLDDGSEVIVLDGWGFPPITEQEKLPHVEMPALWEGDGA